MHKTGLLLNATERIFRKASLYFEDAAIGFITQRPFPWPDERKKTSHLMGNALFLAPVSRDCFRSSRWTCPSDRKTSKSDFDRRLNESEERPCLISSVAHKCSGHEFGSARLKIEVARELP